MKAIPFRRKLKHLYKQFQRDNNHKTVIDFLNDLGLEIRTYGVGKSLYFSYSLDDILHNHGGVAAQKRFTRLCRRLGKAAKKQGKLVDINDIWLVTRGKFAVFYTENDVRKRRLSSDSRDIEFKPKQHVFDVTFQYTGTATVRVEASDSEEASKKALDHSGYQSTKNKVLLSVSPISYKKDLDYYRV